MDGMLLLFVVFFNSFLYFHLFIIFNNEGVDYLILDHRTIEDLFNKYQETTEPAQRRRLVNEMIRELSMHTVIEEQYLYPLCQQVILEDHEGIINLYF